MTAIQLSGDVKFEETNLRNGKQAVTAKQPVVGQPMGISAIA
jgi:hypothetical protein